MDKKTVKDIDVKGKTVLVRNDFNVPISKDGQVQDDTRIAKALPTINYLLDQGAKVVVMSHLGRPKGEVDESLRLNNVAEKLSELLGKPVKKLDDCVGEEVKKEISEAKPGEVILLENTRFYPGEKENDPAFAKELADLADIFVSDAFGAVHRAHASTVGVTKFLPSVAGLLLEKEIKILTEVLTNPKRPLVAIIGGAKISTKLGVISKLLDKVDVLLLGGALANTILKGRGVQVGKSLVEDGMLEEANALPIDKETLEIPVDVVVAKERKEGVPSEIKGTGALSSDDQIMDIGPDTVKLFNNIIKNAKMVIWNGPLGVFEIPEFAKGTNEIAKAIVDSGAKAVIGGGETVDAVKEQGLEDKIWHVSTGGGAMLEFLEGKELPGIAALEDK